MNSRIARMAWVSAAGLLSMNHVQAVEADQAPSEPAIASPAIHPLLDAGLTFGGDTLATTFFTDGHRTDIKAGQLPQLHGGLEYRAGSQLGFKPRHVSEKHDAMGAFSGVTVDGPPIGLTMNGSL